MSLWKIALRNIQHRALASVLTAFSMALGVGLVVAVIVIHGVIDKSFKRGAQGYDLIVGPKGSPLELVLSTVYHLGKPMGRIPYDFYLELAEGRFSPEVELAIPVCVGGNYKGFRVIGTTPDMFDELEYRPVWIAKTHRAHAIRHRGSKGHVERLAQHIDAPSAKCLVAGIEVRR